MMLAMLALSVHLVSGQVEAPREKPQPVKLLPVWVAPASGGVSQTIAVAVLFAIESARPCGGVPKEPCPFGPMFLGGLFIGTIAVHAVTLVATVTLAIINAVRVGDAKKSAAVTFDGVALRF